MKPDPLLLPLARVAAVVGPGRVRLACGHVRRHELEADEYVLLAATMPCAACPPVAFDAAGGGVAD